MTLRQFAAAVGTEPKWVQNAAALLRLRLRYTSEEARRLGLVRQIQESLGIPLGRAYAMAREAVDANVAERGVSGKLAVVGRAPDDSVTLTVDLGRYLSSFAARLSYALELAEPRRRGRRRGAATGKAALAAATDYGVDLDLIRASLALSPDERLRRLDRNAAFLRALRAAR